MQPTPASAPLQTPGYGSNKSKRGVIKVLVEGSSSPWYISRETDGSYDVTKTIERALGVRLSHEAGFTLIEVPVSLCSSSLMDSG